MSALRFENGRAYSDEEIILDDVCEFCQIRRVPRNPDTGEVRMPDLLSYSTAGVVAHWKVCPCA